MYLLDAFLCAHVATFAGAPEFWRSDQKGQERDLHFRNGYPQVYYSFLSNMVHLGLDQFVVPFPSPSRMAAGLLIHHSVQPDLIHIDAAHEYQDVLEDVTMWWEVLAPGGVMLGDDFSETWPGVQQAVSDFSALHKLKYHVDIPKWYIQKPK